MSHSIPRMTWRLCTSSSLARRYYTLNGSPACNSAPPMDPARRNAVAMEPARNNATATYPPAARRTAAGPATCPYALRARRPPARPSNVPVRATRPPAAHVRHARRPHAPRAQKSAATRKGQRRHEASRKQALEQTEEPVHEQRGHGGAHERSNAGHEQAVLPVVVSLVLDRK